MISNYFKIALRNLFKHKGNTLIHIIGLALGLACFLLINEYIQFEKSYDNFHYHDKQLFRLTTDNVVGNQIQVRDAMSFAPSGAVLKEEIPEILDYTTTYKTWRMVFRKDNLPVEENWVVAVDSNFLNLFYYEIAEGDKQTLLAEPFTMVLSESKAKKYFGDEDPVGQSIHVLGNFDRPFKVTGIIRDIPENTHYRFDVLVSLKSFEQRIQRDAWSGFNYYTYLLLNENSDINKVEEKLRPLAKKYLGEQTTLVFNFQPVKDIHLHSDFTYEPESHGSAKAVYFLSIISVLILLIAWVNYINLSTARALERAREVGLRKVVGATRYQLIKQFFTEAFFVNMLGALTALLISQILLPYFHELVGKSIITSVWGHIPFLTKLAIFALIGTLITGFYPALVLSSFKPIGVLRGSFTRSSGGILLRKGLVVFQFAASLALIAASLIVYQQIQYMTGKDLGITTDQVVGISNPRISGDEEEAFSSKYRSFTNELERNEFIISAGGISNLPGGGSADISSNSGGVRIVGISDRVESTVYITTIDDQLQRTLDVELIAGRNFNRDFAADTANVVVNRSLLNLLNVSEPESALNEFIQFGRNPESDRYQIVGVFEDYNRTTLRSRVEPTVFFYDQAPDHTVVQLNLRNSDFTSVMNSIQLLWNRFFPNSPFTYTMLDERFEQLYMEDKKLGFIFANFAFLAIVVALLGLLGLASLISIQRTKEVGVRKILGASVSDIIFLFYKDFLMLILISVAFGLPVVYLAMNDWLNSYAYRIGFPWWVVLIAAGIIALLAFLTVGIQTYKTASLNPAKTLRHE